MGEPVSFVVKVGGGKGIDLDNVLEDLLNYDRYILVHGGSHETNLLSEKLGHSPRFVTSPSGHVSRFTDSRTLEIFEMAYAGKINVGIVESLQRRGVNALGLTGVDGRLLEGKRKPAIRVVENGKRKVLRGDFTGKVEKVNTSLLSAIMDLGYIPVITVPAISYDGEAINVDGDRAAAMVASSMGISRLIILSNVSGLLRDVDDEDSLINAIPRDRIEEFQKFAKGRMKKKLLGAEEAIGNGVNEVVFSSANIPNPVRSALEGHGTVIR